RHCPHRFQDSDLLQPLDNGHKDCVCNPGHRDEERDHGDREDHHTGRGHKCHDGLFDLAEAHHLHIRELIEPAFQSGHIGTLLDSYPDGGDLVRLGDVLQRLHGDEYGAVVLSTAPLQDSRHLELDIPYVY